MPSSFARETITRKRYPTIDDLGTPVVDYSANPTSIDITGCWLEPVESTVSDAGQVLTVDAWRGAAPVTADLVDRDMVTYQGVDYKVIGDPQRVPSPSGRLSQLLFLIRRWDRA